MVIPVAAKNQAIRDIQNRLQAIWLNDREDQQYVAAVVNPSLNECTHELNGKRCRNVVSNYFNPLKLVVEVPDHVANVM